MAIKNIIRVFRMATEAEVLEGTRWYREARELALELDPRNPHRAAGVIAALSPMRPWDQNVKLARSFYQGHDMRVMKAQLAKCQSCVVARDADEVERVLNGPKITSFFRCIMGSQDHVAVDRHALDVSRGYSVLHTNERLRSKFLSRKGNMEKVQQEYRKAAQALGLDPSSLQAVCWVAWRRIKAESGRTNFKLSEVALG